MRQTNTAIAGKENRAKLTGKAYVNCWNEVEACAVLEARAFRFHKNRKNSLLKIQVYIARGKRGANNKEECFCMEELLCS